MSGQRYLLIDAYNVICATDALREAMKQNLDSARDLLADQVRSIHDAENLHLAIVLDSKNDRLEVEHPFGEKSFEFVYAPAAVSADGVIERMVARIKKSGEATVVSNDRMVRESARANGAFALTPEELFQWAHACEQRLMQDVQRRQSANAKSFRNGIDLEL